MPFWCFLKVGFWPLPAIRYKWSRGTGFVRLTPEAQSFIDEPLFFVGFIGLNNGNGRGSMDSFWLFNSLIPFSL
jgi:hypothetical protein